MQWSQRKDPGCRKKWGFIYLAEWSRSPRSRVKEEEERALLEILARFPGVEKGP